MMNNLRDTIMGHMKNTESLNPTHISMLQDRLSHILSQFHTPDHPPYAAMIHRAIVELKQKGGLTEKSISEFIRREYDDLPWAHCSLLKHHLGVLSEHGEITVSRGRGVRYSVCGAGSSKGSTKGGKKHRRKKWKWKFERKRTKRLKLVTRVIDQNSLVAGTDVIETEKDQNGGLQTPDHNGTVGTVPLQLTDGDEEDICSGSKAMDIDPPLLVLADGRENQVGIDQKQQEDCRLQLDNISGVSAVELHALNPSEDAIHELSSPEIPPGFEFMGVEVSTFPSEKKEQQREAQPKPVAEELEKPVAEELEKTDLPCPLQPVQEKKQEKKKGKHPKGGQLEIKLGQNEIVLALPRTQKESPMQDDCSQRQLRHWSGDLPDISHTVNVLSSSEKSGKCPPVEITSTVEKSKVLKKLPSKFTIITRRTSKLSSSQRRSARPQPVSVSPAPSMDLEQDEGSNHLPVCHSTQLLKFPQQDKDIPLKKYQRRGRRPKDTIVQDEQSLADMQKELQEKIPEATLTRRTSHFRTTRTSRRTSIN